MIELLLDELVNYWFYPRFPATAGIFCGIIYCELVFLKGVYDYRYALAQGCAWLPEVQSGTDTLGTSRVRGR